MSKGYLLLAGLFLLLLGGGFAVWAIPKSGEKYKPLFVAAEKKYGLPENLLARVAYQESRFRDDIISGKLKSGAGAVGIMQIVPRWHPGIDPLDVPAAVDYAGRYLAQLKGQFGTWVHALAAYNWGQGNLKKFLSGEVKTMPEETRKYIYEISRDIF